MATKRDPLFRLRGPDIPGPSRSSAVPRIAAGSVDSASATDSTAMASPMDSADSAADVVSAAQSTWTAIIGTNEKLVKLAKLQNIGQARRNRELWHRTWRWRMVAVSILTGLVLFFVKTIYMSIENYPVLRTWWDEAHRDPARYLKWGAVVPNARDSAGGILSVAMGTVNEGTGPGKSTGVTMRQVATVIDRYPIAVVANLLLTWKNLSRKGALFLRACIKYFEVDNPQTRRRVNGAGRLNLLHFQGQLADYMSGDWTPERMISNAASTGDSNMITRESLWKSWQASAMNGNIWYDLFPQTADGLAKVPLMNCLIGSTAGSNISAEMDFRSLVNGGLVNVATVETSRKRADGLAKVPLMNCLIGSTAGSNISAEMDFRSLVNGGLVNVATVETSQGESVNALLGKCFGSLPQGMAGDCAAQKRSGAVDGALGMGMVGPGFMGMIPGPVIVLMTIGGAAAGAIVGGAAAEESCAASDCKNTKR